MTTDFRALRLKGWLKTLLTILFPMLIISVFVASGTTQAPSPRTPNPVAQTSTKKKTLNPKTTPCTPPVSCPHS